MDGTMSADVTASVANDAAELPGGSAIVVDDFQKLLGFKVDADSFLGEVAGLVKGLAHGEAVTAAVVTGMAGIALILVLQRWLPKVPAVLVMVVLAIAAASVFNLADHGVSLVGVLPEGFPPLTIPDISVSNLGPLLGGALGIALVSLADTISTASAFAARTGQEIDGNGEMIGIGVANLDAGLFQGFPSHQRLAYRSGRTVRGQDPAHRDHRGRVDHRNDRAGPGPVPEPPAAGARRGGDHRLAVIG